MKRLFALFLLTFTLGAMAMEEEPVNNDGSIIVSNNNNNGDRVNNDALCDAIQNDNVLEVSKILDAGVVNIDAMNHYYRVAPIHLAAISGNSAIITLLLERGADINNPRNLSGYSALHLAAIHGHHDVIQLFLEHGANINATAAYGNTPLHSAVYTRHFEAAQILNSCGANILLQNRNGGTPVHSLAQLLDKPGAKDLLIEILGRAHLYGSLDALLQLQDKKGRTFLDLIPDPQFKNGLTYELSIWKRAVGTNVRSASKFLLSREHNIRTMKL